MINRIHINARIRMLMAQFWTRLASSKPLAVLRIGVAGVLLYQALLLSGSVDRLYGPTSLVSWDSLRQVNAFPVAPGSLLHLSRLSELVQPIGIDATTCVRGVFLLYVCSLLALLVGIRTRLAAIAGFGTHILLTSSAPATVYGVDQFARIALFYCLWMPVNDSLSLDRFLGYLTAPNRILARISLRVLQLHLAIMYLATGLHKASGPQWFNGEAIWRAVTLPELAQFDFTWLADIPHLAILMGWATVGLEVGYCLLIWHRSSRVPVAISVICMHLGIALVMGLHSFALLMIALNIPAIALNHDLSCELFRDQTEETDGDRTRQREGWPAGDNPPEPKTIAGRLSHANNGHQRETSASQ